MNKFAEKKGNDGRIFGTKKQAKKQKRFFACVRPRVWLSCMHGALQGIGVSPQREETGLFDGYGQIVEAVFGAVRLLRIIHGAGRPLVGVVAGGDKIYFGGGKRGVVRFLPVERKAAQAGRKFAASHGNLLFSRFAHDRYGVGGLFGKGDAARRKRQLRGVETGIIFLQIPVRVFFFWGERRFGNVIADDALFVRKVGVVVGILYGRLGARFVIGDGNGVIEQRDLLPGDGSGGVRIHRAHAVNGFERGSVVEGAEPHFGNDGVGVAVFAPERGDLDGLAVLFDGIRRRERQFGAQVVYFMIADAVVRIGRKRFRRNGVGAVRGVEGDGERVRGRRICHRVLEALVIGRIVVRRSLPVCAQRGLHFDAAGGKSKYAGRR